MQTGDNGLSGFCPRGAGRNDCFHHLQLPDWMSPYFCFEALRAKDVGLRGSFRGSGILGDFDYVYPCRRCLPMGFRWALFFAQRFNENVVEHCPYLHDSKISYDNSKPVVFTAGFTGTKRHCIYVDNLGLQTTVRTALAKNE